MPGRGRTADTSPRRLEPDLLTAGHRVTRVPTQLTAGVRRSGRAPGKSEPITLKPLRCRWRRSAAAQDLPFAELDGPTREVKLRVDHGCDLVAERTRLHFRLRRHLHSWDLGSFANAAQTRLRSVAGCRLRTYAE